MEIDQNKTFGPKQERVGKVLIWTRTWGVIFWERLISAERKNTVFYLLSQSVIRECQCSSQILVNLLNCMNHVLNAKMPFISDLIYSFKIAG